MPDSIFIDSNIWLYAFIATADARHEIAAKLLTSRSADIVISTQVLNEVTFNLLRKVDVDEAFIQKFLTDAYEKYRIANIGASTLLSASGLRTTIHVSYWDSIILATAIENKCPILYSEDLQHGQVIDGTLRIVNPFLNL